VLVNNFSAVVRSVVFLYKVSVFYIVSICGILIFDGS
jgi:hypothetical protein